VAAAPILTGAVETTGQVGGTEKLGSRGGRDKEVQWKWKEVERGWRAEAKQDRRL
jgi:hypothetical protein